VREVPCSEPFPTMPIAQLTNELIALQTLRVAYYMDPGVPDYLPWTSKSLYRWLASAVGGIDVKTQPGQLECCETFGGRKYIVESMQPDNQREYKREWPGIASTLDFLVHEARHADDGPPHTTGCVAFRNSSGPPGCDRSYDVQRLGSYGVQYWLNQSWMTGRLNVGIACSPNAERYARQHLSALNLQFRNRFVENAPPLETLPSPPYGGQCFAQGAETSKPGTPPLRALRRSKRGVGALRRFVFPAGREVLLPRNLERADDNGGGRRLVLLIREHALLDSRTDEIHELVTARLVDREVSSFVQHRRVRLEHRGE
jgi:hypothetical protein